MNSNLSKNELKQFIGGNDNELSFAGEDNCKDASCSGGWVCSGTGENSGTSDCYKAYDKCGGFIRCN